MDRLCLFIFLSISTATTWATPSKMIGASALSQKIFQRIFESQSGTKEWSLVDLYYYQIAPTSFTTHLGFYEPGSFEIKNADPNSFNMILIARLVDNVAQTLSQQCSTTSSIVSSTETPRLKPKLAQLVLQLCSWPSPAAVDPVQLQLFMSQITSFDFTALEQKTWLDYFSLPQHRNKIGSEIVYEMTFTLMMNPYYLLKK